jgi:apolipoprotein N-acyltransferase
VRKTLAAEAPLATRSRREHPVARPALAALSGLLLFLSFPKFGHAAVAFVALGPLLLALPGTHGRRAFALGWLSGVVSALGLLYWTALVVVQFGGLAWPLAAAGLLLLASAYALFQGLFAWLVADWCRRFGHAALLAAPLAWVAVELARAHTLFRFPWCLLGYSQLANLPLIQIASVTAVYGVSCLLAACSATLAYVALEPARAARGRALAGLALLLAGVLGFGWWRLAQPEPRGARLRVGLVQASIPQDEKWDAAHALANVARHVRLTHAAAQQGARLVVWPESAVPYYYDDTPVIAEQIDALARRLGVALLFGNDDRRGPPDRERFYVGAKMVDPSGRLALRYHKIRLVPFGEYVPLRGLFTLGDRVGARLVQQVSDFTPGDEYALGEVPGGRLAALICYEAIFPDLAREFSARGAGLLVSITNDGWYGRTSAPDQHFAMAAFRAVENGVYLVRAANTGISAVVDPSGRVLARTQLFERTALVHDVTLAAPASGGRTFYARHGDVFAWGCLIGAALPTLATRLRRRGR